jgi:pimeloyl-ACP methyl ester carboxylesterase
MFATTAGFYLLQHRIIFQGEPLSKDYEFHFDPPFKEYSIPTADGEILNALLFRAGQPAKGLILYFHGNADNLQRWGMYAVDFTQLGYDVLMTDYRGYGKSTGTPTESAFYTDAETVLRWSESNLHYTKLVYYGRSLGSAVASNLAMENTPDLLILETPFDEISGAMYVPVKMVLSVFPLKYRFPNHIFLSKVGCKKVIIHGTDDWVVPLSSAMNLKRRLQPHDQFIIIEGGGHRNLRDFEAFHKALAEALQ